MEIKTPKEYSLYHVFLTYLITFCLLTLLLVLFIFSLFTIGLNSGVLLPANYGQNHIEEIKNDIVSQSGDQVCQASHPYSVGFFDQQQHLIRSNFSEKEARAAINYLNNHPTKTQIFFAKVELDKGVCVISYDMLAHFSKEKLDYFMPYPEYILLFSFLLLFIVMTSTIVVKFGRKLKRELDPLRFATYQIMNQDLDFDISPTSIKEYNDVLFSISKMKEALKMSLESQWKTEQLKNDQIAALAHDVKTPLTIISGNAQLLVESELCDEDKDYLKYIIKNTDKIEKYMTQLLDVSKGEGSLDVEFDLIQATQFFKEVADEAMMMAQAKNIKSHFVLKKTIATFYGNQELLMRAINNIVTNAIDYTPENSEMKITVDSKDGFLKLTVMDCGSGFTTHGLRYATQQFYMEQPARKGGKHYGMGLYIAQTIAKKHGGAVQLTNRKDARGAQVSITVKLKEKQEEEEK